jgi:hypothetical protein
MMKRSVLLSLAAGLIASFALATPSHASTIVMGTESFAILSPGTTTATNLELLFSPGVLTPSTVVTYSSALGISSYTTTANTLAFFFSAANSGTINFSFVTSALPSAVGLLGNPSLSGLSGAVQSISASASVSASAVPEPTSMALLGIGVAGFLTFRRFFKRTAIA